MSTYQKLKQLNLDLSPIGLGLGSERSDYVATPKGAKVIGWEGMDGVHCCFVKGFEDMVFTVDPSDLPGRQVHPVAASFEDFLRLLLTCGHTAAIEQAYDWDQTKFNAFLAENPMTET